MRILGLTGGIGSGKSMVAQMFAQLGAAVVDADQLSIANSPFEQQAAKFDPTEFKDRYEDALRDLIARKSKGEKLVTSEAPEEDVKVVDLMEALKKSLKGGGGPSREKADRFLEAQARKAKPKARKRTSSRKRAA